MSPDVGGDAHDIRRTGHVAHLFVARRAASPLYSTVRTVEMIRNETETKLKQSGDKTVSKMFCFSHDSRETY